MVTNLKVGYKVTYIPNMQIGIVKTIRDINTAWIVYHCSNNWKEYKNYTGCLTYNSDMKLGWLIKA